jgi:predicted dienelactone hydrolase
MRRAMAIGGLFATWILSGSALADPYAATPGPRKVETFKADWHDVTRNRDIPILICYPGDLGKDSEKLPVIVFSHGLGGSREGYTAYGQHWASYGYVVIFPQHHGSDTAVIGHGMYQMLMGKGDAQAFIDRVHDVHFVIDQIEAMNAGKLDGKEYQPFQGTLDLSKIGMSGHSFGAITTEAVVGEKFLGDPDGKIVDHRIKAGIAMSGAGSKMLDQDTAFGSISIPVFYLTGTDDKMGLSKPADRRIAFDHSKSPDTFLVTFAGANHMTFSPRQSVIPQPQKEKYQNWIRQSTTAFWDAYLKGDENARRWLTQDFPRELGNDGVFETKK